MPKIYVALSTFAQQSRKPLELLERTGWDFKLNQTKARLNKQHLLQEAQDADGIVAGVEIYDAEALKVLPALKCISRCGVGCDNIDLPYAQQKGITVLTTPESVVQPVAEMTVAMIFDLMRRLTAHTALMRQRRWEKIVGTQLAGKAVGIVGLGRTGRRVAELLKRLDTHVCAYDVAPDWAWAQGQGMALVGLDELLEHCDVVTLHVAASAQHPFQLAKAEMTRMKRGAFLVNVARGSLVDEAALVDALNSGHLAGAALDVYPQEPYVGPLCDLPNVILTPHAATLTQEARPAMEAEAVENIIHFFQASLTRAL